MKFKKQILFISLFTISIISFIPRVRANPVPIGSISTFQFFKLFLLFIGTILIESFIIKRFLWEEKPEETPTRFYKYVFAVNLFTYPITQIIALLFSLFYYGVIFFYFMIEVIPITIECLLYIKIFKNLNEIYYFGYPVENRTIVISTITANIATFVFGFFVFLIYP